MNKEEFLKHKRFELLYKRRWAESGPSISVCGHRELKRYVDGSTCGGWKCQLEEMEIYFNKIKRDKKKKFRIICRIFGHPQSGNIWLQGMDTYCNRCGRMNLP